jgi:hypothetical protein
MKLTKEQAIELFAILYHYETINENLSNDMYNLCSDLKEFILTDEKEDDEEVYTKKNNHKTSKEDDDDFESEDSEEDEDQSYEEQEEDFEDEKVDCEVYRSDIVDLPKCSAIVVQSSEFDVNEKVKIEFDHVVPSDSGATLLLVTHKDSQRYIEPILFLKRRGNEIIIGETNQKYGRVKEWHTFEVTKFPKQWTKLIPVDKLVEIVD